jgi:hypothetical protein
MPEDGEKQNPPEMPEKIQWRSCPLVDEFPGSLLFVLAFAAACAVTAYAFGNAAYALVAAGLLAVSLGRYFISTGFVLDSEGVTVRFFGQTRRVAWDMIKSVSVGPKGVFLSPFEKPSRLDSRSRNRPVSIPSAACS